MFGPRSLLGCGSSRLVCITTGLVALLPSISFIGPTPANAAPAVNATAGDRLHASGLVVLGKRRFENLDPNPRALADALDRFEYLSEQNPNELAHPWIDRTSGRLVIGAATDAGANKGNQKYLDASLNAVSPHVPRVRFSRAHLEKIKDEVLELRAAGVPDADLAWQSYVEPEHNRAVVTVERASDALLHALAQRYGTEALAVRVDPHRREPWSRQSDVSPFSGASGIIVRYASGGTYAGCTSGAPWDRYHDRANGWADVRGLLTAGHCAPRPTSSGWNVSSSQAIGRVVYTDSTFTGGTGTTALPYDFSPSAKEADGTIRRGDMALIISPYHNVSPRIYIGSPTSTTRAWVKEMWSRRSQMNDPFCTSGARTGALCGWKVSLPYHNISYSNGIARNVVEGKRSGTCAGPGDSGSPQYTVRADGTISIKGAALSGGKTAPNGCWLDYTDIWSAYYGFPGVLAK